MNGIYKVFEHTPGAERETIFDFDKKEADIDAAPGQRATLPFDSLACDGDKFDVQITYGDTARCYAGVLSGGKIEGEMHFVGGMEGVVVEFSTDSRPVEAPAGGPGGPPPGGPGGPPPGGPGGPPPGGPGGPPPGGPGGPPPGGPGGPPPKHA